MLFACVSTTFKPKTYQHLGTETTSTTLLRIWTLLLVPHLNLYGSFDDIKFIWLYRRHQLIYGCFDAKVSQIVVMHICTR